ncbi:MAG: cytochrome C [Desulfuromonas sp.]|uniref:hypothetical protein n=1 Tax=Desulfuromonas sp. TaxID=892 RepID=UPI000CB29301|nr:hypothetical protein [Desulfuromonas sp.]PLX86518.1 MAG: cytochrome C [Desulfuromonas sp.]
MKNRKLNTVLLTVATALAVLTFGAGTAFAAHPTVWPAGYPDAGEDLTIPVNTFEELSMQYGMWDGEGNLIPMQVQVDGNSLKGMPYSPKQTCGTSGCHVYDGVDQDYGMISKHAFHSSLAYGEWNDASTTAFTADQVKPWTQTGGMWGKW